MNADLIVPRLSYLQSLTGYPGRATRLHDSGNSGSNDAKYYQMSAIEPTIFSYGFGRFKMEMDRAGRNIKRPLRLQRGFTGIPNASHLP